MRPPIAARPWSEPSLTKDIGLKDFSMDKRSADDMRRIIVFHPDEATPRFAWAPLDTYRDEGW